MTAFPITTPPSTWPHPDSATRYGTVSRWFHWGMALCFAVVFAAALAHYFLPKSDIEGLLWPLHRPVGALLMLLVVLRAAWVLDQAGSAAARTDVSAIKLVSSRLQTRVLDRAMQVFGAMSLSPDTPLARLWAWGRALRFLDGPDEVHLRSVARAELKRAKGQRGANAAHLRRGMPAESERR